jgi:hypothetical protein
LGVLKTAAFIKSNTYDVFYYENICKKPLLQDKSLPMQIGFKDLENNTW